MFLYEAYQKRDFTKVFGAINAGSSVTNNENYWNDLLNRNGLKMEQVNSTIVLKQKWKTSFMKKK